MMRAIGRAQQGLQDRAKIHVEVIARCSGNIYKTCATLIMKRSDLLSLQSCAIACSLEPSKSTPAAQMLNFVHCIEGHIIWPMKHESQDEMTE